MAKRAASDPSKTVAEVVQRLVDARGADTVYGDIYRRRAGAVLENVLPLAQYKALKGVQRDIDEAVKQTKAATALQDWKRVETLAAQVESLRKNAAEKASLSTLAAKVYEASGVAIDPFSPGFDSLPGRNPDLAEVRDGLVEGLKALAAADPTLAAFYDTRRAFFSGFSLLSTRAAPKKTTAASEADLEQLAAQAAQQGDMAQLRHYAQQLATRRAKEQQGSSEQSSTAAPVQHTTYRAPVDLGAPFPKDAVGRAGELGLAVARTEPLAQATPLIEYVFSRVWQPDLSGAETEQEGTMRAEAAVDEAGFPKEVSEPVKVLVGQFLRNPFVNSGGARFLPHFNAEEVLIEDFAEQGEPPASGGLLSALGLPRRRGLSRLDIDDALQEHGATIVQQRLGLDPVEFRLVSIPHDLYMRVGRERGWGGQEQWTHFDGYQVLRSGGLRALVGGDVRHGGLSDLLSIGITDQRECVVARFAVIRRARQVARWR
jgi:hypothetical protein